MGVLKNCEGFGIYGPFGLPIIEGPRARACRNKLENQNAADRRANDTEQKGIEEESDVLKEYFQSQEDIWQAYYRNYDGTNPSESIAASVAGAVPSVVQGATTAIGAGLTGGLSMLPSAVGGLLGAPASVPSSVVPGVDNTTLLLGGLAVGAVALALSGRK